MKVKRPHLLYFQRRQQAEFSLDDLFSGGGGVVKRQCWVALAPHLGAEVVVDHGDLAVFDHVGVDESSSRADLEARFGPNRIQRLVDVGLLLGDHDAHAELCARDAKYKVTPWWGPAALANALGRWEGADVAADAARVGERTWSGLVAEFGAPPDEAPTLRPREDWVPLPRERHTGLDDLLMARSTCRNFDESMPLPTADLALVLRRVFGAQGREAFAGGAAALKKNSPSGGGLHPIEAYLIVQSVDGVSPGLYHYQAGEHVLERLRLLDATQARDAARTLVAGQAWFANAPVLVLMAGRFERNYWKYRHNSKAWRVIQLDAGHLSQNLYLSATELGYGAFVTAAINDDVAERLFELDGITCGAVAVCGFGRRSGRADHIEFDPLGKAVR